MKSALKTTAARPARKPANTRVSIDFGDGKKPIVVNLPTMLWDKFCEVHENDMVKVGAALSEALWAHLKPNPTTVHFTTAQLTRLRNAAVIVGCSVEELIVSGAMHGLDCGGDGLNDAKAGLLWSVESYARQRKTFVHADGFGENSARHPLQTTANNGDPVHV